MFNIITTLSFEQVAPFAASFIIISMSALAIYITCKDNAQRREAIIKNREMSLDIEAIDIPDKQTDSHTKNN